MDKLREQHGIKKAGRPSPILKSGEANGGHTKYHE
jgi:hypothetical protein